MTATLSIRVGFDTDGAASIITKDWASVYTSRQALRCIDWASKTRDLRGRRTRRDQARVDIAPARPSRADQEVAKLDVEGVAIERRWATGRSTARCRQV
ncbi:MAG: hypothetical protein U0Q08_05015 [Dermatophilaceae bacterium]